MLSVFLKLSSVMFISAGTTYLVSILLAKLLVPEEMGLIALFVAYSVFFQSIIGFSLHSVSQKFDTEATTELEKYKIIYLLISYILLSSLILFFVLIFIFKNNENYYILITALFHATSINAIAVIRTHLNNNSKTYEFVKNLILSTILATIFTIALVSLLPDWKSRAFSLIISDIAAILYFCINIKIISFKDVIKDLNTRDLMQRLKLSVPMIIHSIFAAVYGFGDRIILQNNIGERALGAYWLIFQISIPIFFVYEVYSRTYLPRLNSLIKSEQTEKINSDKHNLIIVTLALIFTIHLLPLDFISSAFPNYGINALQLKIGTTVQIMNGYYVVLSLYLISTGRTENLMWITIVTVLLQLTLLILIIPVYKVDGALGVNCAASLFRCALITIAYTKNSKGKV